MKDTMKSLRGMIIPLVTPVTEEYEVDTGALQRLCEIQNKAGIDTLCVLGTTGEFYGLGPAQHRQVVETTVETVAGRVSVVTGICRDSTALPSSRMV